MQKTGFLIFLLFILFGCKRYTDPNPISDDRLTNPYCNDPAAVNYNWGFPGKPDNSVCIYPSAIFSGQYLVQDTVWSADLTPIFTSEFPLEIVALDTVRLQLKGFCNNDIHTARANRFLRFTMDTLIGNGQLFCAGKDTLSLTGTKNFISDTASFSIEYQLNTDTGIVIHRGRAYKQ